ncbi:hypothetical protein [Williamsoniiplasma luminosum]|uniref:DUF4064 domain-containing protein n=1 Tax=Williamsoniiplasma luminosum TaxID=214888 RepID=A0A2S0NKR2_9MOLU|nr:hypothetical protein [Williamsoniiplasma luminosum]AVP49613.1 MAG: hypothetical protein C5T88_03500 [Williamsoniiplasma luminosum]
MKTKFEGNYKAGTICCLVGSSILLGITTILLLVVIITAIAASHTSGPMTLGAGMFLFILFMICLIPNILIVVFTIISLKTKTTDKKILIGVLAIIFGLLIGLIGGIIMLVAPQEMIEDEKIGNELR